MTGNRVLKVAFVGGPMYDHLYEQIPHFESETEYQVEIAIRLNHPALNERMASDFSGAQDAGYDLISTHSKYAPSQRTFLLPLDRVIAEEELVDFSPRMVEHARIEGKLYGVPRNIDVKLLYYRTDLFSDPQNRKNYLKRFGRELRTPGTWDELRDVAEFFSRPPELYGFVFPGRYSGLFGHFFELDAMAGGRLFGDNLQFNFHDDAGRWALGFLAELYQKKLVPPEVPGWHYDEVTRCFLEGRCAMTTDWPSGYHLFKNPDTSRVSGSFGMALYPVGPSGKRFVYSGGHTFAIPRSVRNLEGASALLRFLTSPENQYLEAKRGAIAARVSAQKRIRGEAAAGSLDAGRLALLETTVEKHMLIPPKFPEYPAVEDVLWTSLSAAIVGTISVDEGLDRALQQIRGIFSTRVTDGDS